MSYSYGRCNLTNTSHQIPGRPCFWLFSWSQSTLRTQAQNEARTASEQWQCSQSLGQRLLHHHHFWKVSPSDSCGWKGGLHLACTKHWILCLAFFRLTLIRKKAASENAASTGCGTTLINCKNRVHTTGWGLGLRRESSKSCRQVCLQREGNKSHHYHHPKEALGCISA